MRFVLNPMEWPICKSFFTPLTWIVTLLLLTLHSAISSILSLVWFGVYKWSAVLPTSFLGLRRSLLLFAGEDKNEVH